jgi:putative ABC transport system permease protein
MRVLTFFSEVAAMAVRDLAARPLRAFLSLTSFATSISIAVVLVAAGDGLRAAAAEILRNLGQGQILVTPGRTTGMGGQRRAGRPVRLRFEDVEGIGSTLPSIEGVAPFFDLRGGGASSRRYSIPFSPAKAVAPGYLKVRQLPVIEGRWFTRAEEEEGQWVTVLNEGLRKIIFPEGTAVGQWMEWRGRRMMVVGVVRDEALFPYIFFLPYHTVSQLADARYISGLIARPAPGATWDRAVAEVRRVLAGLGGFDPNDENALEVEDNREFTARISTFAGALHLLVITIAGVSLLLGGLGVANMMVISVTERTREIGLRKAVGATPAGIFLQVLCESLTIVACGGGLGMALGGLACAAVGQLEMSSKYAAQIGFDPVAASVSLAGLAAVAVLAGVIPARRAAALPAAEALRWE